MTQIGGARGAPPKTTTGTEPVGTPSSAKAPPLPLVVSPGNLTPGPNTYWGPPAGAPAAWQSGLVSGEAKTDRVEAELNGTAITIGASEARVAAGEAIKEAQAKTTVATTTVNQETTTATTDDTVDVVGTAAKQTERDLKAEAEHDDQVAKQRTVELDKITEARVQSDLESSATVA